MMKQTWKKAAVLLLAGACVSCNGPVTPPDVTMDTADMTTLETQTAETTADSSVTEPEEPSYVVNPNFVPGIGDISLGIKRDGPADVNW